MERTAGACSAAAQAVVQRSLSSVTVVIATRNRWSTLRRTLDELSALPDQPQLIVVDNASSDGSPQRVRDAYPDVDVVALPANAGAAGRNVGVRLASTALVAFADDDSWWAGGALTAAAAVMDADPAIGLIAACVLVGSDQLLDPTSAQMARGPLAYRGRPVVTGFLACAVVVRRAAFLAVGGFEPFLLIGGEEEMVAADLADAGWKLVYEPGIVAHHHPSTVRDSSARRQLLARNSVLTAGLRYSASQTGRRVGRLARPGGIADAGAGLLGATRLAPWAAAHRRPVSGATEAGFVGRPGR